MRVDGGVLNAVEMATYLFGGVDAVVKVGDEAGDGPFEVDVVLPESVVGVDEQGLADPMPEGLARSLVWEAHGLIIKAVAAVPRAPSRRYGRNATLGGCMLRSACVRLEAMVNQDVAPLEDVGVKRATHDRRADADVGYRVWNPFEAELRTDAGGGHDEVAEGFTRALDVFDR